MKTLLVVCLALLLASSALGADRREEWSRDLDALEESLAAVHPRFRPCGVTGETRVALAALRRRVGDLSDPEISVEVQRILATVGDGHTLLWPFGMRRGALHRIPVMLWEFDDGTFVVRADGPEIVGRRVTRIGTLPADEVFRRLRPYVSHDNELQLRWAAPFYATIPEFLHAVGAVTDPGRVAITFDGGRSMTFGGSPIDPARLELKLPPPGGDRVPLYQRHPTSSTWLETLSDGTVYVQLNAIDEALAAFGQELHAALLGARRAVVDLRLNNGGDARKANEVLKALVAFDVRGGRLAVLTGRMTFSAAQTLATRLDEWTGAVFVGEPTGSRPNHYGNERPFTLPGSGLRGTVASGWNQPISANDARDAILPEIPVPQSAQAYFGGDDPVLESAVEALSRR